MIPATLNMYADELEEEPKMTVPIFLIALPHLDENLNITITLPRTSEKVFFETSITDITHIPSIRADMLPRVFIEVRILRENVVPATNG